MDKLRDSESVKAQYSNGDNLNTRISLHTKYSINKQGFRSWIYEQYHFFNGCSVLRAGLRNRRHVDQSEYKGLDGKQRLSAFSQEWSMRLRRNSAVTKMFPLSK